MNGSFHTKVRGVTFRNQDGGDRQKYILAFCKPGMPVTLKREKHNPYDENAVAVWITARAFFFFTSDVQIGYLSEHVAEEIGPFLDEGGEVLAEIANVTHGGPRSTLGVNLLLHKI